MSAELTNVELNQQEFQLIQEYRKAQVNLELTDEERAMILQYRGQFVSATDKYIENLEKMCVSPFAEIRRIAIKLTDESKKLRRSEISLQEYKKIPRFSSESEDLVVQTAVDQMNYIKQRIEQYYPN